MFNPDTWKQQWVAFMSAPYIIFPLLAIVAVVVWWFRGTMFQSTIAGLREQIKVLGTQKTIFEDRMQLASEKVNLERGNQESLARQISNLKGEIDKAGNDDLAARVAKVETALAELVAASNAVRSVVSGIINATEGPDIASFRGTVE